MPIAQDRADYFWLAANDPVTAVMPEPETFQNSKVTPLIDLEEYVAKLKDAFATVGVHADPNQNQGDFIYIAGWWLGLLRGNVTPPSSGFDSTGYTIADTEGFNLDPTDATRERLIDILKEKSRRGVDVRVMGWVSYAIMTDRPHPMLWIFPPLQTAVANSLQANNAGVASMARINAQTMNAIKELRSEPTMAKKCLLNILGHSAGAVHVKGCIVGKKPAVGNADAIAFTGGLDFEQGRWAEFGHEPDPAWTAASQTPIWHDVQAAVEGPAAQGFYNFYMQMWNEILSRDAQDFRFEGKRIKTYVSGTPNVSPQTIDGTPLPTAGLTHHVQSLRTIPAFNYHWYNCLPEGQAASFASSGLFELRAAWRKAILAAKRYIYIEDQSYYSREIMEWINTAIRAQPNLRVIIMMQGAGDPNDVPDQTSDIHNEVFNIGLLGIDQGAGAASQPLTNAQRNQIRVCKVWGESFIVPDANGQPLTGQIATVDSAPADAIHITINGLVNDGPDDPLPADVVQNMFHFIVTPSGSWRIRGNLQAAKNAPIVIRLEKVLPAPTAGQAAQFGKTYGILTHSKITIIDDKWAMIGSANFMRRSLYTDWEHSVAFLDENETAVKEFRKRIWAEHFNQPDTPAGLAPFDDIDEAIGGWDAGDPAWKTTANTPPWPTRMPNDRGPDYIQRVPLPFPVAAMSEERRAEFDGYRDPDSREAWGGLCKP